MATLVGSAVLFISGRHAWRELGSFAEADVVGALDLMARREVSTGDLVFLRSQLSNDAALSVGFLRVATGEGSLCDEIMISEAVRWLPEEVASAEATEIASASAINANCGEGSLASLANSVVGSRTCQPEALVEPDILLRFCGRRR